MYIRTNILLQSIKSVCGFMAIWGAAMFIIFVGLSQFPWITLPIVLLSMIGFMVYMEYNKRVDLHTIEVMSKIRVAKNRVSVKETK